MQSYHLPVEGFTAYIDARVNDGEFHNRAHEHHQCYELLYLIEGGRRIVIDGTEHHATGGDLVVFHPWMVHEEFVAPGPYRLVCLRFNSADIGNAVTFPGPDDVGVVFRLPWRARFQNIVEQIVIETEKPDEWSPLLRRTYLTQFIALLWRALSFCRDETEQGNEQARMRIAHVVDLIHSGMQGDLTLAGLADKAFMSESHFSHVFKDVTGVSPKRYLIASRMARACELLADTDSTVVDISAELGYDNPQYFSRLFKKETGRTPLQYRRAHRQRA